MFALYEWFVLPMTITCRPLKSFFLFSFCFIFFLCTFAKKKLYIHRYLWEKLSSLYTYVPIHEKNFFLYKHTHWKTLSLYTDMVYIKSLFLFKDFFPPFQYTLVVYIKISFIYTHCSYTRIYFHTLFIYKNFFSFLYIQIWHFVHNVSFFFYSWRYYNVCSFYFRMTFLNENSTRFRNFKNSDWLIDIFVMILIFWWFIHKHRYFDNLSLSFLISIFIWIFLWS